MTAPRPYRAYLITRPAQLEELAHSLSEGGAFSFDVESRPPDTNDAIDEDALNPHRARMISAQFGRKWLDQIDCYYVNLDPAFDEALIADDFIRLVKPVFQNPQLTLVGHNLKFDLQQLMGLSARTTGEFLESSNELFDTLVADWLLDENSKRRGLEILADRECGITLLDREEAWKTREGKMQYALDDVYVPLLLMDKFAPRLAEQNLYTALSEVEMPYIRSLIEMEFFGLFVDRVLLSKIGEETKAKIEAAATEVYAAAGRKFLLSSPKQVSQVLFGEMKIPVKPGTPMIKVGKRGEETQIPSTAKGVLERYKGTPVVDKLLEHRKLEKRQSSFIVPLLELSDTALGRVRSSMNQTVVVTGRLSSSRPNLQNIPREKNLLRGVFRAYPGNKLIVADLNQAELRTMAHFSQDPALLLAYREGKDVHQQTADKCKISRQDAKIVNFGLIYRMSAEALAEFLKCPVEEATRIRDAYFREFAGVKKMHYLVKDVLDARGYVKTLAGRRRRFPHWKHLPVDKRGYEWRQAINAVIQGSVADIIKKATNEMHRRVREHNWGNVRFVSQVHDEILIESPTDYAEEVAAVLRDVLATIVELRVPMFGEAGVGDTWEEAKSKAA